MGTINPAIENLLNEVLENKFRNIVVDYGPHWQYSSNRAQFILLMKAMDIDTFGEAVAKFLQNKYPREKFSYIKTVFENKPAEGILSLEFHGKYSFLDIYTQNDFRGELQRDENNERIPNLTMFIKFYPDRNRGFINRLKKFLEQSTKTADSLVNTP